MTWLRLSNISRHFGAIEALSEIDLTVAPGEAIGLMGDNGAGKSTLLKLIAGNFPPSGGTLSIADAPMHFHGPLDARRAGIEVVYQDLALCPNLSAAANLFLGREMTRRIGPINLLNKSAMRVRAQELVTELGADVRVDQPVRNLSGGQRQAIAIARTMLSDAKLVLLDEPTAAISVKQVKEVLDLINTLRSRGVAIILVSHRMPDVFATCTRIVVLRRGRKVADKAASRSSPEEVTALITGALDSSFDRGAAQ